VPKFRLRRLSAPAVRAWGLQVFASSVPPARRNARKDHANEDDQDSDLNPDEPAELSENDFDAIAPRGRQSVADRLYAMRRCSQPPFDPVRPVIKRHSGEMRRRLSAVIPNRFDQARNCAGSDRSILSRIGWGLARRIGGISYRRGIMTAACDLFRDSKQVGNMRSAGGLSLQAIPQDRKRTQRMKDFSNASFSPELINAMDEALAGAVATLPHPVSSTRVRNLAESILRSAKQGESNPRTLQMMALVEMQIRSGEQ
jgi:hypothetical protein